eukprot:TRINITY_DN14146_c0_g1_i1.p2 TRINITY_DN14146_c0_g1~~TRINITY_DN14146_c0_g1_i1.p2  ORF type:complete len:198 (-),score=19.49 TRINITY_DN14146_c0_g1_i1:10-603(-)
MTCCLGKRGAVRALQRGSFHGALSAAGGAVALVLTLWRRPLAAVVVRVLECTLALQRKPVLCVMEVAAIRARPARRAAAAGARGASTHVRSVASSAAAVASLHWTLKVARGAMVPATCAVTASGVPRAVAAVWTHLRAMWDAMRATTLATVLLTNANHCHLHHHQCSQHLLLKMHFWFLFQLYLHLQLWCVQFGSPR